MNEWLADLVAEDRHSLAAYKKPYELVDYTVIDFGTLSEQNALLAAATLVFEKKEPYVPAGGWNGGDGEPAEGEDEGQGEEGDHQEEAAGNVDADGPSDEQLIFAQLVDANFRSGAGRTFFLELTGCQQVKALSQNNIENYSKMMRLPGAPTDASKFIDYWSRMTPKLTDIGNFTARAETVEFVRYHIGASTTGGLCQQALESSPFPDYFSQAEQDLISAASRAPWDITSARAINNVTIVKANAWLEIIDRRPQTWYMGGKAVDQFPAVHYKLLVENLKKAMTFVKDGSVAPDGAHMDVISQKIKDVLAGAANEA